MVEKCANSACNFRQFEYVGDISQMRRGVLEQIAERRQVGEYENQA